jgi:hypothetical protein
MHKIMLATFATGGLMLALPTIGSASAASRLLDGGPAVQAGHAEPVYYNRNHHRYRHRSWDKRHRRWRYY